MNSNFKKMGPLEVLTNEKSWDPNRETIFMLHGYGANAFDLAPLANELRTNRPLNWVFPQAPLSLDFGVFEGRAWFHIDINALNRAIQEDRLTDWMNRTPQGLESARAQVIKMIEASGIPWSKVILGGFSQGGMMVMDVALRAPERPKGLLLFSTAVMSAAQWGELAKKGQGVPFFQSHGTSDQVLPLETAEALNELLNGAGWSGEFQTFSGGHEIPGRVLQSASRFLNNL